jgi:hypothetical protein
LYIGVAGHSFTIDRDDPDHAQAAINVLPGGGPSVILNGDIQVDNIPTSMLRNGSLNNTLLAQTITLGLNLGVTTALGNLELVNGMLLVTAEPANECNTTSNDIVVCSYVASTLVSAPVITFLTNNVWDGDSFEPDISADKEATVVELFQLASSALGGNAYGQSLTAIAGLADQINNNFDGCRVFIGYLTAEQFTALTSGCTTTTAAALYGRGEFNLSAAPNPFFSSVRFDFTATESGNARLEVFDLLGRKIANVYQGYIEAGTRRTVEYRVGTHNRVPMIYRLTIKNKTSFGKLIPGSSD